MRAVLHSDTFLEGSGIGLVLGRKGGGGSGEWGKKGSMYPCVSLVGWREGAMSTSQSNTFSKFVGFCTKRQTQSNQKLTKDLYNLYSHKL